ncbi:hypothetical protein ACIN8IBEIGE_220010 [Acinetobacter sp. 8I-beige]|nr:hypothetical protein ACIN8IBEIGE_220010 [Acinetobacter sp. 8I-beige]
MKIFKFNVCRMLINHMSLLFFSKYMFYGYYFVLLYLFSNASQIFHIKYEVKYKIKLHFNI